MLSVIEGLCITEGLTMTESLTVRSVVELAAGDFLRAMKCRGSLLIPAQAHDAKTACIHLSKMTSIATASDLYSIATERLGKTTRITFKLSDWYSCDSQDELARLTLDATCSLCLKVIEDSGGIEEDTLNLLPLYRETCEELRRCPEKTAEWLNEKGIHYYAAKNFLQGEKDDDHSADDSNTRFDSDYARSTHKT